MNKAPQTPLAQWMIRLVGNSLAVVLLLFLAQHLTIQAYWETHPEEYVKAVVWKPSLDKKVEFALKQQAEQAKKERQEKEQQEKARQVAESLNKMLEPYGLNLPQEATPQK